MLPITLAVIALSAAPDHKMADLVRQLASPKFRIRESAAKELVAGGSSSMAALAAGMRNDDLEVRERCRQLLPEAAARERNRNLIALLANPAAPPPTSLAGVKRFLEVAGDTPQSREAYAAMLRRHHAGLELLESNPAKATERLGEFITEAVQRGEASSVLSINGQETVFDSPADIAYFLFAAADARIRKGDQPELFSDAYALFGKQMLDAIKNASAGPARKLFLHWLEKETDAELWESGMELAVNAKVREVVPLLLRDIGKKEGGRTRLLPQKIIALGNLGGKEHLPHLQPHLSDEMVIGAIRFGRGKSLTAQVRDVALAVSIHLSGQKRTDYGFDAKQGGNALPTSYHQLGFPNQATRDAAHAKWKEWVAKNPIEGKNKK